MPPKTRLTQADVYEVMHRVGYAQIAHLASGELYRTLVHGLRAEYFLLEIGADDDVPSDTLVDALDNLGVARAVIDDAIDQLGS